MFFHLFVEFDFCSFSKYHVWQVNVNRNLVMMACVLFYKAEVIRQNCFFLFLLVFYRMFFPKYLHCCRYRFDIHQFSPLCMFFPKGNDIRCNLLSGDSLSTGYIQEIIYHSYLLCITESCFLFEILAGSFVFSVKTLTS